MNTKHLPPIVQMYDKSVVREYYKRYQGLIFSHEEIIRTDKLSNELVMDIHSERMPDKILYNGKEVELKFK